MKKKQQGSAKAFIIVIIMLALVVGYYFYLSHKAPAAREEKRLTEVEEVLLRNLSTDYPPSPKEVVKYYAEITKCFYDGNYDDIQLKELADRSRELFDDELRANQTDEDYFQDLQADIAYYRQNNLKISSYATSSSVDVEYKKTSSGELASLYCLFNIREGTVLKSSNHQFILRKDEKGHWKILGWTLAKEEEEAQSE
ncbi:MAG: hypothetical protein IKR68_03310 [Lachnospiraceae bacterium]|nr:hypothetical protein [Lachnospiraceae bacterium]